VRIRPGMPKLRLSFSFDAKVAPSLFQLRLQSVM